MTIVKVSKGPRVKWDGMRRWNLNRVAAVLPVVPTVQPLPPRPVEALKLHLSPLELSLSKAMSVESSEVSGQGSGEGGRDGLRRPAPWSLAQGSGVFRSPLPAARSPFGPPG